jgi:1-aminocyclopropane-1-carboxylate deaminase/D-cysteine desulfhydrase-like pyridoxal-dependent ACC family enzyme
MNILKNIFENKTIAISTLQDEQLSKRHIQLDVLHLHELDPVISGNKWFKLKYYLNDAIEKKFNKIATYGGAFSNHIVATAKACSVFNIASMGVIRGEKPKVFSPTLLEAQALGMELLFVSRTEYRDKKKIQQNFPEYYWVNEGGYGILGAVGAAEILKLVKDLHLYSHIVLAVGTGATMAGIIEAALLHQETIGISVLKNNYSLSANVQALLSEEAKNKKHAIYHDFHFGGYAKHPPEVLDFMNEIWLKHKLPTDFVYTAKALKAIFLLNENEKLPEGSRVLFIHTGGLQGNRGLDIGC